VAKANLLPINLFSKLCSITCWVSNLRTAGYQWQLVSLSFSSIFNIQTEFALNIFNNFLRFVFKWTTFNLINKHYYKTSSYSNLETGPNQSCLIMWYILWSHLQFCQIFYLFNFVNCLLMTVNNFECILTFTQHI
jgi:hypothetical protein